MSKSNGHSSSGDLTPHQAAGILDDEAFAQMARKIERRKGFSLSFAFAQACLKENMSGSAIVEALVTHRHITSGYAKRVVLAVAVDMSISMLASGVSHRRILRRLGTVFNYCQNSRTRILNLARRELVDGMPGGEDELRKTAGSMYMAIVADPKTKDTAKIEAIKAYCKLFGLNLERRVKVHLHGEAGSSGVQVELARAVAILEGHKTAPVLDASTIAQSYLGMGHSNGNGNGKHSPTVLDVESSGPLDGDDDEDEDDSDDGE